MRLRQCADRKSRPSSSERRARRIVWRFFLHLPTGYFQTLIEWSAEPLNTEPLKATRASTVVVWRTRVWVQRRVSRSQTRMVVSYEPLKTLLVPDRHSEYTAPVWPLSVCTDSSVSRL